MHGGAGAMRQEVAQGDRLCSRELVVRYSPGFQVAIDVKIQIQRPSLNLLHHKRRRQGLADGCTSEDGSGLDRPPRAAFQVAEATAPCQCAIVKHGDTDARTAVMRQPLVDSTTRIFAHNADDWQQAVL